ncbi:hypothetical protein F5148DRAFT_1316333 [Russula earlei]|uniref:Uncharacterized protein n=1 Tax=Russula earlei TaxID=71964 RepID=A0ACC0UJ61_9AGAM|nr:hypothetical protein F5148DRAFT_1316333 [Russula earlei]
MPGPGDDLYTPQSWKHSISMWMVKRMAHTGPRVPDIVFAYPRRLNLRSEILDILPVFPVAISLPRPLWKCSESNHHWHHRMCEINLFRIPTSHWQRQCRTILAADISVKEHAVTSLSDLFLGGSACATLSCLPLTLSCSTIGSFPIRVTFRPRLWSPPCPSCPHSKSFTLDSNPLNLDPIRRLDLDLHSLALFSLLSPIFCSMAFTSTLKTY